MPPRILTDYVIIEEQSPLWRERTDCVRRTPPWKIAALKSGIPPAGLRGALDRLDNAPLVAALKLLCRRGKYDIVITGDFQTGIWFSLLNNLLRGGWKPHLLLDLMLDEPQDSWRWRLKHVLHKRALAGVKAVSVLSQAEREYYARFLGLPPEKFVHIPGHTNIPNPRPVDTDDGYIFSAGRSGRDYRTLLAAVEGLEAELVIVSDRRSMEGIERPAANLRVYHDVPYRRYLELLAGAKIVVIPLVRHLRTLGTVVIMEAMALGKPVITTSGVTTVEHIIDGKTGLLVEIGDVQGIKKKILWLLQNPEECAKMGNAAYQEVISNLTFDRYVTTVLSVAEQIAAELVGSL